MMPFRHEIHSGCLFSLQADISTHVRSYASILLSHSRATDLDLPRRDTQAHWLWLQTETQVRLAPSLEARTRGEWEGEQFRFRTARP